MKVSKKPSLLISIVVGVLAALIIAIFCLSVSATMILNGKLDPNNEIIVITGTHFLTALIGCTISGIISDKPPISCAGMLGALMLLEISMTVFVFAGEFYNVLPSLLADLVGAAAALMLLIPVKNRKNKGVKKYRTR